MLFESLAHAMGGAPGGEGGNPLGAFLPLILMFAIFYFLLIRPQQKKAKAHKEMLANLRRGQKVLASGFEGVIVDIDGDDLKVEIAENVVVKMKRSYVAMADAGAAKADSSKKDEKK
jgi:preprotein translocase subunit YajC